MAHHCEHIDEIQGLDSLVTQAVGEYSVLISACEKQMQQTLPVEKGDALEEALIKIEKETWERYEEVVQESKAQEELQVQALKRSRIFAKLEKEKKYLDKNAKDDVAVFDKKLDTIVSELILALTQEEYASAMPLIATKQKIKNEAEHINDFSHRLSACIEHISLLGSIKPKISIDTTTLSGIISATPIFEEPARLLTYDPEAQAVLSYIPENQCVHKFPIIETRIPKGFAQVLFGYDKLLLCGGKNHAPQFFKDAFVFTEGEEQLTAIEPMLGARANHSLLNRSDLEIYAIGGEGTQEITLCTAEFYHIANKVWKALPSMNEGKKNAVLVLFASKYIYAISALSAKDVSVEILDVIECKGWIKKELNVSIGPWTKFGCVQVNIRELLIFGGEIKGKKTKKCVLYDTSVSEHIVTQELPSESYFCSSDIIKKGNQVYALSSDKSRIYNYRIKEDKWNMIYTEDFTLKYT